MSTESKGSSKFPAIIPPLNSYFEVLEQRMVFRDVPFVGFGFPAGRRAGGNPH